MDLLWVDLPDPKSRCSHFQKDLLRYLKEYQKLQIHHFKLSNPYCVWMYSRALFYPAFIRCFQNIIMIMLETGITQRVVIWSSYFRLLYFTQHKTRIWQVQEGISIRENTYLDVRKREKQGTLMCAGRIRTSTDKRVFVALSPIYGFYYVTSGQQSGWCRHLFFR